MMMNVWISQVRFPPQGVMVDFVWALFGTLAAVALVLTVIVQWKKAFGRVPSLSSIISGLATLKHIEDLSGKITNLAGTVSGFASKKDFEKATTDRDDIRSELHTRSRGIEEQVAAIRHELRSEYQGFKIAAENRQENTDEKFAVVRAEVATLRERTETTNRKIDSMDTKLDNIWRSIAPRLKNQ